LAAWPTNGNKKLMMPRWLERLDRSNSELTKEIGRSDVEQTDLILVEPPPRLLKLAPGRDINPNDRNGNQTIPLLSDRAEASE